MLVAVARRPPCPRLAIASNTKINRITHQFSVLGDRNIEHGYIVSAKSADELTSRLLLAVGQQEPLIVYTDGFRAYDPLAEPRDSTRNTSFTEPVYTPTTRST